MSKFTRKTTHLIISSFFIFSLLSATALGTEILYTFDFESGCEDWSSDNYVWKIEMSDKEKGNCHSGRNCPMADLEGKLSSTSLNRFISPAIYIPETEPGEIISLQFWHRFVFDDKRQNSDSGLIEVDAGNDEWKTTFGPFTGVQLDWQEVHVDVTKFKNTKIEISFAVFSKSPGADSWWQIDDITIEVLNGDAINASQLIKKKISK